MTTFFNARAKITVELLRNVAREFEVLLRLARGESVDAIATSLHLSTKRVANLQSSVRAKLALSNAVELVHYARRNGLVTE